MSSIAANRRSSRQHTKAGTAWKASVAADDLDEHPKQHDQGEQPVATWNAPTYRFNHSQTGLTALMPAGHHDGAGLDSCSSSDGESDLNERSDEESEDPEEAELPSVSARSRSHAGAAPGPGSSAAAKASGSKQKGSKKRAAAVAFMDAISLLPADLDVETIVRTRQQLQPRNRMQKQALLQGYRQQHDRWRFLLR